MNVEPNAVLHGNLTLSHLLPHRPGAGDVDTSRTSVPAGLEEAQKTRVRAAPEAPPRRPSGSGHHLTCSVPLPRNDPSTFWLKVEDNPCQSLGKGRG